MIIMEPIDTLFFRDGKPFSMGDQSTAFGIFPPNPSTVLGAIRTGIISQNKGYIKFLSGEMAQEIGTVADFSNSSLKLKGIFLYNSNDDYFYMPAPFDLFREEDGKAKRTSIKTAHLFSTNLDFDRFPFTVEKNKAKSVESFYLTHTDFFSYLTGASDDFNIYHESKFCRIEYKTGIKMSPLTRSSAEGRLYRVGMRRFDEGWMLACDLDGATSLRKSGVLKMGGEGKVCRYERISSALQDKHQKVLDQVKKTGIIKLYFATPAIFKNGWFPDEDLVNGADFRLELLSASVGNPVYVGGWDMGKAGGKGWHKPMMRAVPAGSVYYYRVVSGEVEKVYGKLHYNNISLKASEGFGLAFVGGCK
jgi:CRISPR-associated protein Cmr3